jgi:HK97 family phage prohead protease
LSRGFKIHGGNATVEQRKTLAAADLAALPDSAFAYIDSKGGRHLPVNDAAHVRAAISRFNQTDFESSTARKNAALKILQAAKKFGIAVDVKSAVAVAATGKGTVSPARSGSPDAEVRAAIRLARERDIERLVDLHRSEEASRIRRRQVDVVRRPPLVAARAVSLEARMEIRRGTAGSREVRRCPVDSFEVRDAPNGVGGTDLVFRGYAAITGVDYDMVDHAGAFVERIAPGAFKKTLEAAADVVFLVNHSGMALARTKSGTLRLSEDGTGLHAEARLDPSNAVVQDVRSAVVRGDLDEMSFAFRVPKERGQIWNADFTDRTIIEANLSQGDVSLVNYAANPHTGGTVSVGQRSAPAGDAAEELALLVSANRRLEERRKKGRKKPKKAKSKAFSDSSGNTLADPAQSGAVGNCEV